MAPKAPTFKVALVQMHPKPLSPEANFKTASDYITTAAKDGASLAVLPEYHLTGWVPEDPLFIKIASQAEDYVKKYQQLASQVKINIVTGTIVTAAPHLDPPANGSTTTLVNIATFISYTGEVLGSYTKTNLWHPERPHLTSSVAATASRGTSYKPAGTEAFCTSPSSPHSIIETPLGPIGILVCWDIAFPEAFRSLVMAGAKIIIVPTFWMMTDCSPEGLAYNKDAESLFLSTTLITRAYENTAAIIFVNAGGPKEDGFAGLSQVAMPLVGAVKGSFDGPDEGMRLVDVDMEILEVAERNYKMREDLAKDNWHYGYSHEVKQNGA